MSNFDPVEYLTNRTNEVCKPGLERVSKLLDELGNPQNNLKFVHVAGTNGKGSTCAYLSTVFIESGYKTGLFTSPFVYEFNERIKIDNKNISVDELSDIVLKVKAIAENFDTDDQPTAFELVTACAYLYFAQQNCDIVVCEVGLGGLYDATNVIPPKSCIACIICPINIDHTNYLGNTIEKIAHEKAGIIKYETKVFSAQQQNVAVDIINKTAVDNNTSVCYMQNSDVVLHKVDLSQNKLIRSFRYKGIEYKTQLLGKYQPYNAAIAIESLNYLKTIFSNITDNNIFNGVYKTLWPGRFELICDKPVIIVDGGHNCQGVDALIESLKDVFPNYKYNFIMGVLKDKDYTEMVKKITPYANKVYTVTPDIYRALSADKLAHAFKEQGICANAVDIYKSIEIAKKEAKDNELVCAFGSLYSIASYNY